MANSISSMELVFSLCVLAFLAGSKRFFERGCMKKYTVYDLVYIYKIYIKKKLRYIE